MSTIQIDRLLERTTIKQVLASDLHISVGHPPVLRLNGGLRDLATKVLEPDDTIALNEVDHAGPLPSRNCRKWARRTSASPSPRP